MEMMINVNGKEIKAVEYAGNMYVNTTMHNINCFDNDGNLVILPASGVRVDARSSQVEVGKRNGITFVKSSFDVDEASQKIVDEMIEAFPDVIIVGSIIAAQAYPGKVCGLCSVPGYERVAPNEKRMRLDQFITY